MERPKVPPGPGHPTLMGRCDVRHAHRMPLTGTGADWQQDGLGLTARTDLDGRGRARVRYVPRRNGGAGRPRMLLLHGWTATADTNFGRLYPLLSERFELLALDHRGHGGGIRATVPFRLEDCADDAAAFLRQHGGGPVLVAGYSMGGPIALLLARRHPELVGGVLLCATAPWFGQPLQRVVMHRLGAVARRIPSGLERLPRFAAAAGRPLGGVLPGAVGVARHDVRRLLEAGRELGRFSAAPWAAELGTAAAVVLTTADRLVPPGSQGALARLTGASVHAVAAGHDAPVRHPYRLAAGMLRAATAVQAAAECRPAAAA